MFLAEEKTIGQLVEESMDNFGSDYLNTVVIIVITTTTFATMMMKQITIINSMIIKRITINLPPQLG